MSRAKEQAREAAKSRFFDSARPHLPAYLEHACIVSADAASDVWEPLLREALRALRTMGEKYCGEYCTGADCPNAERHPFHALTTKVKEALDG